MKRKILAIVNPHSSNGNTGREWHKLERCIKEADIEFDIEFTKYPLHATELARNALMSGYEIIVSVGGDGTINEVINGFFHEDKPINKNASLAVLSKGTGCDFVRTIGMDKSVQGLINALKNNNSICCDVGKCTFVKYSKEETTRYFLNVSDVGIGGETTYRVNKNSKALKGFLSFLIGTITTIAVYKNKNLKVIIDDKLIVDEKINSVIIANGRYFGGGMEVAPTAVIDDGLFDIIVLGDFTKPELIMNFPRIYKGTHMSHPKVKGYRGKSVVIESKDIALVELDGEQPGTLNAEYHIIPNSINVLI